MTPTTAPRSLCIATTTLLLAFACASLRGDPSAERPAAGQPAGTTRPAAAATATLGVGLRRSAYGLAAKNGDDAWWVERAKGFAASFPGARPTIVQIVSTYQDDGSTQFGFARPASYAGSADHMTFETSKLDPERALSAYDKAGVAAILQLEPGDADVARCLEVTRQALGGHPCVVGYGIDLEWFFTKEPRGGTGRPVTDADAKAWVEGVLSSNRNDTLFLKHWDARHLPPTYRHDKLWFLSDSQDFADSREMMADFKGWAQACDGSVTGYQFGYPKDRKWWSKLSSPPAELAEKIRREIPSCGYLFWVDFTADRVRFGLDVGTRGAEAAPNGKGAKSR